MLEGIYTAAAGMAAQQTRLDALSNDVANVNTAGYQRVRVGFSDLINGNPTLSPDFRFTGPHTVVASTWRQPGEDKVPVTVDLQAAFDNLPR